MKQRFLALTAVAAVAALWLSGCASRSDAMGASAGLQVQAGEQRGSKTVSFAPQPMDCERQPLCPTLGARWSSATPGRAVLLLGFEAGASAPAVQHAIFHTSTHGVQRVQSRSRAEAGAPGVQAFDVPMATLERIAFSKDVWVEVHTGARTVQEVLYNTQGGSRADEALKRLMVEAYRGTDKEVSLGLSGLFAEPPKNR